MASRSTAARFMTWCRSNDLARLRTDLVVHADRRRVDRAFDAGVCVTALDPDGFMAGAGVMWTVALAWRWLERHMRRAWENARTELIARQDRMITDQANSLAHAAIIIGQLTGDELLIAVGERIPLGEK